MGCLHFTADEIMAIRSLHANGMNDGDIADMIGRSKPGIRKARIKLGLERHEPITSFTRQRISRETKRAMRRDCHAGDFGNYLELASSVRSATLGWPPYLSGNDGRVYCWLVSACILFCLRTGPLSTINLFEAVANLRQQRSWKPHKHSRRYLMQALLRLRKSGFIERLGMPSRMDSSAWLWSLAEVANNNLHSRNVSHNVLSVG